MSRRKNVSIGGVISHSGGVVASPQKVLSGYRRARGDVTRSEATAREFEAMLTEATEEIETLKEELRGKESALAQADMD